MPGKIFGSSTDSMEGILEDAASKPVPELVVFIVYDLPNRDCHAKASNGELCCSYKADGRCDYTDVRDSQCRAGLRQYKEEYIDKIAEVLRQFSGRVPVVLVIEPDSLPNLSTNQADPRCGNDATKSAYQRGVSYAVKALAAADPYAAIYLDAGHGGWLGWKDNMQDFVRTIRGLGVSDLIRGFASNVAGVDLSGKILASSDIWCIVVGLRMACVDLFVPLSFFALTVRDREGGALCQSGISMPAMSCGTHFLLPHTKIGGATDPEMISLCHAKVTENQ